MSVGDGEGAVPPSPAAHNEIAGIGIDRALLLDAPGSVLHEFDVQRLREASGDLALGFAKVTTIRFEPVRPHMCAGFTIDQLHIGLNLVTHPPHAAFEDIANAEFMGDLLGVDGFPLISECCVASDHQTVGNLREIGRLDRR